MRVIHTSDWHLGASLHNQKRYDEFQSFLVWLINTIQEQQVEVLLISGDIFDTTTPSNRSQELYYQFLHKVVKSCCRHVVIIGGNHDSPSFLNAPRELLKAFSIQVIGQATENLEDEILVLKNKSGEPELIVLAVPYLRDRDLRLSQAGESDQDKESKMLAGLKEHYAKITSEAANLRKEYNEELPLITMGHLFTQGGQTLEGDGVRDLYVGTLAHVSQDIFGTTPDYVALGHLHIPQTVQGQNNIRYSGSPLPMSFGEANQVKSLCLLEFEGHTPEVSLIPIPKFQSLESIKGDWSHIYKVLSSLVAAKSTAWVEIIYEGQEEIANLRERVAEIVENSELQVLRIKDTRLLKSILSQSPAEEKLADLDVKDIFQRLLTLNNVPEDQQTELMQTYLEAVQELQEKDIRAE
ncbi:exonuclease SbcCD subunit D C-terminal domain-containing protein [bacterium]|nr:exonuclease SbcCD subunit D C-terminal domain-containing protein [bacterium]